MSALRKEGCPPWFTVERIDEETYAISEYRHWEETHCYLLLGKERGLLIDTGLGVGDIRNEVEKLTDLPIAAVATHAHWDHIGGHGSFPVLYAHRKEAVWLAGDFPLPLSSVRAMLKAQCELPEGYDLDQYEIFRGEPTCWLEDGAFLDLGERKLQVFHTPGHSPGHLCFWEEERGYLFSGDLVYQGTLYANYPSTNPDEFLMSMETLRKLPVKRVFPGHHNLDISPNLPAEIWDGLRSLKEAGELRHGAGTFEFEGWAIKL